MTGVAVGGAIAALVAIGVAAAAPVSRHTFPGTTGLLVVASDDGVVVLTPKGNRRRVFESFGIWGGAQPEWSPDGRSIAYTADVIVDDRGTRADVFVVRASGGPRRKLTRGGANVDVAWSHDGSRLLVTVEHGRTERPDLYVMNADGTAKRRLFARGAWRRGGRWSPDGSRIIFQGRDGPYIATAGGRGARRLAVSGSWLPDGSALVSSRDFRVEVVRLDGHVERVLLSDVDASGAVLSPDGRLLAFTGDVEEGLSGVEHVFVTPLDRPSPISISGGNSHSPDWQPLCTIYGTERDDVLRGTPGPDKICGLGGDDVIRDLGGDDVVLGGDGDDVLVGGGGRDWLFAGAGDDRLSGRGSGRDIVDGGPGRDTAAANHPGVDTRRDVEIFR